MKLIEQGLRLGCGALAALAGIALLLMMVQTVLDVVMRNFFGGPIEGNLEIMSIYHMVALVFLPLGFVEMRHEHISVELVVRLFPSWLRRATEVLAYLVAAVFFALLTRQTWLDAVKAFEIGEILMTSMLIIVWPAKFSLPLGFGSVTLACLLHAWKAGTDPDFDPTPTSPDASPDPS
ncbi:MAG: TRAP transporter small permease [Pseudomonadota bacterium]